MRVDLLQERGQRVCLYWSKETVCWLSLGWTCVCVRCVKHLVSSIINPIIIIILDESSHSVVDIHMSRVVVQPHGHVTAVEG